MPSKKQNLDYLKLLAERYPNVESSVRAIVDMSSILRLPKGTEYFFSDLHGENGAFIQLLRSASGVIRDKIDTVYSFTLSEKERDELAALIAHPHTFLSTKRKGCAEADYEDWSALVIHRLVQVLREVASKYNRQRVAEVINPKFANIIDDLITQDPMVSNKVGYYKELIDASIRCGIGDALIVSICRMLQQIAVDQLHILGDIFDRGPRADLIMEELMSHRSVDVQWGNHDIEWIGAVAGNRVCMFSVLRIGLSYNNFDCLEDGYGINLRPLSSFAAKVYANDECKYFKPHMLDLNQYDPVDTALAAKMHKAAAIIMFKLEGQLIRRRPDYGMEGRLLLDKMDLERGVVTIEGKEYALRDTNFPTVDPKDPYRLTDEEAELVSRLVYNFTHSGKLQWHIRFLYAQGGLYKCYNDNLLFHGCIPLEEDGSFTTIRLEGKELSGKSLMDYADKMARQAYFAPEGSPAREHGLDFMWYLWCGKHSPLFGRSRMTTFERYLIEDKSTWTEGKDPYYELNNDPAIAARIIQEFGLDPERAHIINGHVPVKYKDGESPVKAGGKVIVIDGGFCRAYQPTTGLAGYTLIYNSYGLRIVSHAFCLPPPGHRKG